MLGGTITVSSKKGRGSQFIISIQLTCNPETGIIKTFLNRGSLEKPAKSQPDHTGTVATDKKIMLIEDSEPAIVQIKDLLEGSGYHVVAAHSGSEAFEIIKKEVPDAIILDLMMPDIDGFYVLKELREHKRTVNIPVIILTAKQITSEEISFLEKNHVKQLIQKGNIKQTELLNAVANMLRPVEPQTEQKPKKKEGKEKACDIGSRGQRGQHAYD